jgi:UMF1 family MFS transporter
VLFIIANVCFGASIVFYNAFLPEITTEDQADKVSSRGYAYGYLGGALLLALNLLLVLRAEQLGISTGTGGAIVAFVGRCLVGRICAYHFLLLKSRPKEEPSARKELHLSRLSGDCGYFQRVASTAADACVICSAI